MDRSILVVDDDRDTCAVLSDILTDFGYEVDTAQHGAEALERAKQKPYRLALLDFKMPGFTGVELFSRIRELRDGIEGLLITAFASAEAVEAALAAGMRTVLHKPLDVPALIPIVREIMGDAVAS